MAAEQGASLLRWWAGAFVLAVGFAALGVVAIDRLSDAADPRATASPDPGRPVLTEVAGVVETTPPTTTAVTTTTTTSTTTEPPPPIRTAELVFGGDVLSHRGVVRQAAANGEGGAYDFGPSFELVAPRIEAADLAVCHLETPLSPDNSDLSGHPTFNVPGDLAMGLAGAGFDACTTASNHSLDRRFEGIVATLDVLEAAGLAFAGTARTAEEAATPLVMDAGGIAVGQLSYTYGLNGFRIPADQPWSVNVIDVDRMLADVEGIREAGAEFVVVSIHWGTEYRHEPNEEQRVVASALADAGTIDLIVGHHAHVVQPVERIGDTLVLFGLGNFISNQSVNCCAAGAQDGVIMHVHVQDRPQRDGFETWVTHTPTRVDRSDFVIVPVSDAIAAGGRGSLGLAELERSRDRTQAILDPDAEPSVGERLRVTEQR